MFCTVLNGKCLCVLGVNVSTVCYSLKEFLPKEYIKQRGAEKRVFQVRGPLLVLLNLLLLPGKNAIKVQLSACVLPEKGLLVSGHVYLAWEARVHETFTYK